MEESPASDVELWKEFEELSWKQHEKFEYYMAQLTWVLASANGASRMEVEDFLIKFGEAESKTLSQYEGMKRSMSVWEAATGKKAK